MQAGDRTALQDELQAYVQFQRGDGDGLFLGEFRKPVRRVSEHDLGMFLSRQGIRLLDFSAVP